MICPPVVLSSLIRLGDEAFLLGDLTLAQMVDDVTESLLTPPDDEP